MCPVQHRTSIKFLDGGRLFVSLSLLPHIPRQHHTDVVQLFGLLRVDCGKYFRLSPGNPLRGRSVFLKRQCSRKPE